MPEVISIQLDHNPKINCEICDQEIWLLNSKVIKDLEDESYLVCGSCYEDCRIDKMHTV